MRALYSQVLAEELETYNNSGGAHARAGPRGKPRRLFLAPPV